MTPGARLLALGLLALTGCTSVERLAAVLNERQITSCIWATGSYGPFVGVSVLSATGGATIADCRQLR